MNPKFIEAVKKQAVEIAMENPNVTPEEIVARLDSEAAKGNSVYVKFAIKHNFTRKTFKVYSIDSPEENLTKIKVMQKILSAGELFDMNEAGESLSGVASQIVNDGKVERSLDVEAIFLLAELAEKNPEEAKVRYTALPGTPEEKYRKYGKALLASKNGKALLEVIAAGLDGDTKQAILDSSKRTENHFARVAGKESDKQKCAELRNSGFLATMEERLKKVLLLENDVFERMQSLEFLLENNNLKGIQEIIQIVELIEAAEMATPEQLRQKYMEIPNEEKYRSMITKSVQPYAFVDIILEKYKQKIEQEAKESNYLFTTAEEIVEKVKNYREDLLQEIGSNETVFKGRERQKAGLDFFGDEVSKATADKLNAMKGRPTTIVPNTLTNSDNLKAFDEVDPNLGKKPTKTYE